MSESSPSRTIKRACAAGISAAIAVLLTYFLGLTLLQQLAIVFVLAGLLMWFYEHISGNRSPD